MKKLLLITLLLLPLVPIGCGKDTPEEEEVPEIVKTKPTIKKDMSCPSTAMKRGVPFSIWLPPTYDASKSYPVLYLLHGYEWDVATAHNGWLEKGNLSSIATQYVRDGGVPMIVVTPNCPNDFYRDSPGGDQYETFFIQEFIPYIEKEFHGNGKRAIAGLSMGGYGTLYHGFRHPDMFTIMYAMSPATSTWGEPKPTLAELVSTCDKDKLPKITIETGTGDMTVSLSSVESFVDLVKGAGISVAFETRGGGHDWNFWQVCLPKALKKAGESFK